MIIISFVENIIDKLDEFIAHHDTVSLPEEVVDAIMYKKVLNDDYCSEVLNDILQDFLNI